MALNNGEAIAVNTFLNWLTDDALDREPADSPYYVSTTDEQARAAALVLVRAAHKQLMAGWSEQNVEDHWPPGSDPTRRTDERSA